MTIAVENACFPDRILEPSEGLRDQFMVDSRIERAERQIQAAELGDALLTLKEITSTHAGKFSQEVTVLRARLSELERKGRLGTVPNDHLTAEKAKIYEDAVACIAAIRLCSPNEVTAGSQPARRVQFHPELEASLRDSKAAYDKCLDRLEETFTIDRTNVTGSLHFVKHGPTGAPMFYELAEVLWQQAARYALSVQTARGIQLVSDPDTDAIIMKNVRSLFMSAPGENEAGEILLFLLVESLHRAPQVVCKMETKHDPSTRVPGASGIHARWEETDSSLALILSKARLHASLGQALDDLLQEIPKLQDREQQKREFQFVTSNYRFLDQESKSSILRYTLGRALPKTYSVTFACLVGFDLDTYKQLKTNRHRTAEEFRQAYQRRQAEFKRQLKRRLGREVSDMRCEVMFLPFESVDEFQRVFHTELTGVAR
jgi:hypothetical protein